MKKIVLFFAMIVLVVMSARSVFAGSHLYEGDLFSLVQPQPPVADMFNYEVDTSLTITEGSQGESYRYGCLLDYCKTGATNNIALLQDIYGAKIVNSVVLKEKLNEILVRYKQSSQFNEAVCQQILKLFDAEIVLIDDILLGKSGQRVEEKLAAVLNMKRYSTPTALYVYDQVMAIATKDSAIRPKKGASLDDRPIRVELVGKRKKKFLRHMKNILHEARCAVSDMQYQHSFAAGDEQYSVAYKRRKKRQKQQGSQETMRSVNTVGRVHKLDKKRTKKRGMKGGRWNRKAAIAHEVDAASTILPLPIKNVQHKAVHNNAYEVNQLSMGDMLTQKAGKEVEQFQVSFGKFWDDVVKTMRCTTIVPLIDSVISLIEKELQGPILSFGNSFVTTTTNGGREHRSSATYQASSDQAQYIFNGIKKIATQKALRRRTWNSAVYEKTLEKYALQLESVKLESMHMLNNFKQNIRYQVLDASSQLYNAYAKMMKNLLDSIA